MLSNLSKNQCGWLGAADSVMPCYSDHLSPFHDFDKFSEVHRQKSESCQYFSLPLGLPATQACFQLEIVLCYRYQVFHRVPPCFKRRTPPEAHLRLQEPVIAARCHQRGVVCPVGLIQQLAAIRFVVDLRPPIPILMPPEFPLAKSTVTIELGSNTRSRTQCRSLPVFLGFAPVCPAGFPRNPVRLHWQVPLLYFLR